MRFGSGQRVIAAQNNKRPSASTRWNLPNSCRPVIAGEPGGGESLAGPLGGDASERGVCAFELVFADVGDARAKARPSQNS